MLKKYEKIIKGMLNSAHERTSKALFSSDTGFYYVTDGYRMVCFADMINDLPLFQDGEKHYHCVEQYEKANEVEYDTLEIPYTIEQIKAWAKETRKIDKNLKFPFKLGINTSSQWIGINTKFLADAMETTKSNVIHVPRKGRTLLMQGNGFV